MERILVTSAKALYRYFNALSRLGYKKYIDVDKLLVLTFIEELLSTKYYGLITEDDYRDITRAFYHLTGSTCLIDFPSFPSYDKLSKNIMTTAESTKYIILDKKVLWLMPQNNFFDNILIYSNVDWTIS